MPNCIHRTWRRWPPVAAIGTISSPCESSREADLSGCRDAGIASLAENFAVIRVHGNDAIAMILHILGGEIARSVPLRGETDDGDGSLLRQDSTQADDVVDDGHAPSLMEIGPADRARNEGNRACRPLPVGVRPAPRSTTKLWASSRLGRSSTTVIRDAMKHASAWAWRFALA